ncbi:nucleotidyltransferase domain-containing protein [Streptomyces sp. NPDC059991]|uniref:nucleotidyltransferase domain-containing protein n=1 Tax=Streptomyces sp. NPDC059991 TaxID=3347028 RepID=UPI00368205EE
MLKEMLQRLDAGGPWPLELVDAVYVFGSSARGALEPNDVDLAVDFRQDEAMRQRLIAYLVSSGRDPRIDLRQALIGRKRGAQFQFGAAERERLEGDGVVMLRLWSRGMPLAAALAVLDGIQEDPEAGRAQRDDMAEEFEGWDRYIPQTSSVARLGRVSHPAARNSSFSSLTASPLAGLFDMSAPAGPHILPATTRMRWPSACPRAVVKSGCRGGQSSNW